MHFLSQKLQQFIWCLCTNTSTLAGPLFSYLLSKHRHYWGRLEDNKSSFLGVVSVCSFHWVWCMAPVTERPANVHLWLNLSMFLVGFWGTCKPPEEFKGIYRITYINEIIVKKKCSISKQQQRSCSKNFSCYLSCQVSIIMVLFRFL